MIQKERKGKSILKERREALGKSQTEVAVEIGISERAYRNIENGLSIPGLDTAVAIASVIQVPLRVICESVGLDVSKIPLDPITETKGG